MGTGFELYDDINFLMGFESLYEVIDTTLQHQLDKNHKKEIILIIF